MLTENIKKSKKFSVFPDEFFTSVSLKSDSHMTFYMAITSNHTCLVYFIKPIYDWLPCEKIFSFPISVINWHLHR